MVFDIVVLGATGFTGTFVARELSRSLLSSTWPSDSGFSWAIAGRSRTSLQDLRNQIVEERPSSIRMLEPEVLVTDITNYTSVLEMARQARLVLNCAGPFRFLGEPVVRACIEAKTDYLDISGEPEYIEKMSLEYHEKAVSAGVTVVSAAAFDSVPCELGVLAAKHYMLSRNIIPSSIEMFIQLYGSKGLGLNYGTYHSAVEGFAHGATDLKVVRKKLSAIRPKVTPPGPVPKPQSPKSLTFFDKLVKKLGFLRDQRVSGWVIPYFFSDPSVVRMSQTLAHFLQIQNQPPVHFYAYLVIRRSYILLLLILYFPIFRFLTQRSWGMYLLLKYPAIFTHGLVPKSGPSKEMIEGTRFVQEFYAKGYSSSALESFSSPPDVSMKFTLSGPEPGYVTTPIVFVQCALYLLNHREKIVKGVVTPAIAFGDESAHSGGLLEEICRDGHIKWEVV